MNKKKWKLTQVLMALSDIRHKFSTREVTVDNILHPGVIKPVKRTFLLEMSNNVC